MWREPPAWCAIASDSPAKRGRRKHRPLVQRYVLPRQFSDSQDGWELQNMLVVARLSIGAALAREESRGVHIRTDFPATDDLHWQRHLAFRREPGPRR